VVGESVKQKRAKAIVLVPATALVGALIFTVASSPLLASRELVATGCPEPTYELDNRGWEQLPAAVIEQSSADCVGFCFNAIVESESDENSRIARVMVLGEDGTRTRGVVDRTQVLTNSLAAVQGGEPVRFACFDSFAGPGGAPQFDDCVQMVVYKDEAQACATSSEAISDASGHRANELDMFLFGL
jgi:hypothetical protein